MDKRNKAPLGGGKHLLVIPLDNYSRDLLNAHI